MLSGLLAKLDTAVQRIVASPELVPAESISSGLRTLPPISLIGGTAGGVRGWVESDPVDSQALQVTPSNKSISNPPVVLIPIALSEETDLVDFRAASFHPLPATVVKHVVKKMSSSSSEEIENDSAEEDDVEDVAKTENDTAECVSVWRRGEFEQQAGNRHVPAPKTASSSNKLLNPWMVQNSFAINKARHLAYSSAHLAVYDEDNDSSNEIEANVEAAEAAVAETASQVKDGNVPSSLDRSKAAVFTLSRFQDSFLLTRKRQSLHAEHDAQALETQVQEYFPDYSELDNDSDIYSSQEICAAAEVSDSAPSADIAHVEKDEIQDCLKEEHIRQQQDELLEVKKREELEQLLIGKLQRMESSLKQQEFRNNAKIQQEEQMKTEQKAETEKHHGFLKEVEIHQELTKTNEKEEREKECKRQWEIWEQKEQEQALLEETKKMKSLEKNDSTIRMKISEQQEELKKQIKILETKVALEKLRSTLKAQLRQQQQRIMDQTRSRFQTWAPAPQSQSGQSSGRQSRSLLRSDPTPRSRSVGESRHKGSRGPSRETRRAQEDFDKQEPREQETGAQDRIHEWRTSSQTQSPPNNFSVHPVSRNIDVFVSKITWRVWHIYK